MAGPESIAAWSDMVTKMSKNNAERPYFQDNALSENKYFQGRADAAVNQAGLLGEELKYAPQKYQLHNSLLGAQIGSANRSNQGTASDKFASNPGKLFHDYQQIVDRFGANSEQANMFKSMSGLAGGSQSIFGVDDFGNPIPGMGVGAVPGNTGSTSGQGKASAPQYGIDEKGNIFVKPTRQASSRDFRTIAGAENIKEYLGNVKDQLPQFQGFWKRAEISSKGIANRFLGKNYEEPSKLAEAEGSLISAAEGFINTFGLNATNENLNKSLKIFEPRTGESKKGYEARLERQLNDLVNVERRAQQRQAAGVQVGNVYNGNPGIPMAQQTIAPQVQQQMQGAMNQQAPQQKNPDQIQAWANYVISQGADPKAVLAEINKG